MRHNDHFNDNITGNYGLANQSQNRWDNISQIGSASDLLSLAEIVREDDRMIETIRDPKIPVVIPPTKERVRQALIDSQLEGITINSNGDILIR